MRKVAVILAAMILCMTLCTGCWDMVQSDEQNYVLGIGLDVGEAEGNVSVTFQVALPSAMFNEGGGEREQTFSLTTEEHSIEEARFDALFASSEQLNLEHVQIVVITEKLARQGIDSLLNYFFRNVMVRRSLTVVILDESGTLEDLFALEPPNGTPLPEYLVNLVKTNSYSAQSSINASNLLNISLAGLENNRLDYMIDRIGYDQEENKVYIAGGCAVSEGKMVGKLNTDELETLQWLQPGNNAPVVAVYYGEDHWTFQVDNQTTKIKPCVDQEGLRFDIDIAASCQLTETKSGLNSINTMDDQFLNVAAQVVAGKLQWQCEALLERMQKEWNADLLNLETYTRTEQPTWWREHGDTFFQQYPDMRIRLNFIIEVRRVGHVD